MRLYNLITNNIKNNIKNEEYIISFILIIILFLAHNNIPKYIYNIVNNNYGKIILVLISVTIFIKTKSSIVGVITLILASELIRLSNNYNYNNNYSNNRLFSNTENSIKFDNYNKYPVSLEEEIVSNMAPIVKSNVNINSNYKPIINNIHDASLI